MNAHVKYWNKKIISWEENRYTKKNIFSKPLLVRQQVALSHLVTHLNNKTIIELGCGTGLFYKKIKDLDFKKYIGIDFSSVAIQSFQKNMDHTPDSRVSLICQDASIYQPQKSDIVIALGLVDWLKNEQLKMLATNIKECDFLISYSSSTNFQIMTKMHALYSHLLTFKFNSSIKPNYHKDQLMISHFKREHVQTQILSPKGMSIGKIITNIY